MRQVNHSEICEPQWSPVRHVNPQGCRGSTLNMAKPGPERLLVNCKHIFEQDKQPSYVFVLVLS